MTIGEDKLVGKVVARAPNLQVFPCLLERHLHQYRSRTGCCRMQRMFCNGNAPVLLVTCTVGRRTEWERCM